MGLPLLYEVLHAALSQPQDKSSSSRCVTWHTLEKLTFLASVYSEIRRAFRNPVSVTCWSCTWTWSKAAGTLWTMRTIRAADNISSTTSHSAPKVGRPRLTSGDQYVLSLDNVCLPNNPVSSKDPELATAGSPRSQLCSSPSHV
ncbi:uncharacterized protein LOC116079190 isoform X1 [Mastomys coucha]|uniref:uncharacterized protein LOC116079190 isoform X1 n=1 Tax=Mastomys coucha TaxID=35658 RepID=UPI001262AB62|nr:uncharacterized protein LOC116079190 isoform X1 [Mastomys coucha]